MFTIQRPPTANAMPFLLIAGMIAGIRRRYPIGGWLFFFFAQALVSFCRYVDNHVVTNFVSRYWTDSKLHLAFVLVRTPRLLVFSDRSRDPHSVALDVRLAVGNCAALCAHRSLRLWYGGRISGCVALPGVGVSRCGVIITPAIYVGYFFRSTRVRSLFKDRNGTRRSRANVWEG